MEYNTCCEWIGNVLWRRASRKRASSPSLPSFRFRTSGKPSCEVALQTDDPKMRPTASLNTNNANAEEEDNANARLLPIPRRRASAP